MRHILTSRPIWIGVIITVSAVAFAAPDKSSGVGEGEGEGETKEVAPALPDVEVIVPGQAVVDEPETQADSDDEFPARPRLTVAVSPFEPMVIENPDGTFSGFDVELVEAISREVGFDVRYHRVPVFRDLIPSVRDGKADIGIGGVSITEEREKQVDFSHHYFASGLRIAAPGTVIKPSIVPLIIERLFTREILFALFLLFGFAFVCGAILWYVERGKEVIADKFKDGYDDAVWCVWEMITTIGFGDFYPQTHLGRLITVPIFFVGVIVIGLVSAPINAAFIVRDIEVVESKIQELADLRGLKVGTVQGSTSIEPLGRYGATVLATKKIADAFTLLEAGTVDAVVFDAPSIAHYVNGRGKGKMIMVGKLFERQDYGIVFPPGWRLREDVNRALLRLRRSGVYHAMYEKWFGSEDS